MNERIQEIAEQCHHRYSEHRIDLEKFAELIVRDCMAISSEAMTNDNWPPHMIAKHFGVEE